jgi:RNA polymerase sigma-70 factor (sigma-E family)
MSGRPPEDFAEFVVGSLPALLRLGHMLTGSLTAGEDLVQSALVSTLAAWPRINAEGDPFGYVRRAMINGNISVWRRWGSRVHYVDPPERAGRDEGSLTADRLSVRQALGALPARQRTVLVLRYYCDLTEQEIAAEMGCQPGTVKSQAARGLAALRKQLTDPVIATPANLAQEMTP